MAKRRLPPVFGQAQIVYFRDYEKRSRNPDAVDRDRTEADVIILPVVRIERAPDFDHAPCEVPFGE